MCALDKQDEIQRMIALIMAAGSDEMEGFNIPRLLVQNNTIVLANSRGGAWTINFKLEDDGTWSVAPNAKGRRYLKRRGSHTVERNSHIRLDTSTCSVDDVAAITSMYLEAFDDSVVDFIYNRKDSIYQ